ncbi:alpha tubulin suppressor [Lecanora helva]
MPLSLYAWGSNGSGQLGVGSTNDISRPKYCPLPEPLAGRPSKIVAGGNHTLLLFDDGTVLWTGVQYDGGATAGSPSAPSTIFEESYISETMGSKLKFCSAWWEGSVFVDNDSCVFTAGLGSKGEQGIKGSPDSVGIQGLRDFPEDRNQDWGKVIDLATGVDHTVVIVSDNSVWGWGNGRKGQLDDPNEIVQEPRRFENCGYQVARALCGRDFTFLINKDGTHQLFGADKWQLKQDAPAQLPDWKNICVSWGSIFVLNKDGKLASWGRDDHGQLAPPGLPELEQIAAGSEHVVALTKDGKVISWGWGEHGNCGDKKDENGDVKGRWNEIPVNLEPNEKVIGVGAGCATSFLWTDTI